MVRASRRRRKSAKPIRPGDRETAQARARFDRIARFYDLVESPWEWGSFFRWREKLWAEVSGPRILEVGVGTGKNFPYYPRNLRVNAIDFSPRMLERAARRARREGVQVDLRLMDVQKLDFPDDSFDSVVASSVFCSVTDPLLGLKELRRVVKPDGKILLLEHVRPPGVRGKVADLLNPLMVRVWGTNINRSTVENVEQADLEIERVDDLSRGAIQLIVARPRK